jgi:pimeloyl-ACP methyl ester carboxylesterase
MGKKPKLIVLSDIFGEEKSGWKRFYLRSLENHYEVVYYDCCVLGNISKYNVAEKTVHEQYLSTGVDTAVRKLLELEKEPVHVLAFSIGGVIGWRAALAGLPVTHFYAVSSTRLRHESEKPDCPIALLFAENDYFVPERDWFKKLDLEYRVLEFKDHNMYMKPDCARRVTAELIQIPKQLGSSS